MLSKLQLLSLETGPACNLATAHPWCPVNRPERHGGGEPATDEQMIAFLAAAVGRGFCGLVSFHYYNEPLLYLERCLRLAGEAKTLGLGAAIWTNGALLDDLADGWIGAFRRVFVTDHDPARRAWLEAFRDRHEPIVAIKPGGHDCRADVYSARPALRARPCWRPVVTELPVDCFGSVHLCCVDWRGEQRIGDIRAEDHDEIIDRWIAAAADAARGELEICRKCQGLPRCPIIPTQEKRL
jgi:sulfatase maturation enzyme AslB (radical SAM superfamily)